MRAWAVPTLEAAGLPTDYRVRYSVEDVTAWAPHDGERYPECGHATCALRRQHARFRTHSRGLRRPIH
ncbi:MAG: hypothetical protein U5K43_01600 [Halofilum sp. (in: g-proteobacteria)]|nr:hypothetical protein [Halofilum sp. (in: g-proteobacteria)]